MQPPVATASQAAQQAAFQSEYQQVPEDAGITSSFMSAMQMMGMASESMTVPMQQGGPAVSTQQPGLQMQRPCNSTRQQHHAAQDVMRGSNHMSQGSGLMDGRQQGSGGMKEAAIIERLSIKVHGVTPDMLPPDVRERLRTWIASSDLELLQVS